MNRLNLLRNSLMVVLIFVSTITVYSQNVKKYVNACKPIDKEYYSEIPINNISDVAFIPVKINNKEYNFLLDTGSPSAISKEIAEELKLKPVYSEKLTDGTGTVGVVDFTVLPQLTIGNITYKNVFATIDDFSVFGSFGECNMMSGVIGTDILKNGVCKFTAQSIILTNNIDNLNESVAPSKLILTDRYNPILSTSLYFGEDELEESMIFDSGLSDYVHWSKASFNIATKAFPTKPKIVKGIGKGFISAFDQTSSIESRKKAIVNTVKIGNAALNNLECYVSQEDGSSIGFRILELFDLTIDWKNNKYYLTKKNDKQDSNFGFRYNSEGIINELWEDSPLNKENIKIGDQILTVNGTKLHELSKCDFIEYRNKVLKEDKITLSIDGKNKIIEVSKK